MGARTAYPAGLKRLDGEIGGWSDLGLFVAIQRGGFRLIFERHLPEFFGDAAVCRFAGVKGAHLRKLYQLGMTVHGFFPPAAITPPSYERGGLTALGGQGKPRGG